MTCKDVNAGDVVGYVTARDPEGDALTFSLASDLGFDIDASSGIISATRQPVGSQQHHLSQSYTLSSVFPLLSSLFSVIHCVDMKLPVGSHQHNCIFIAIIKSGCRYICTNLDDSITIHHSPIRL